MAAAREGEVEFHADGSVTLAGVTLAADEVEIQATPRPGTAVAHDDGLVVVIDTELTPELRAEGDARELQRAIQDLRKEAELELDDRIELWVDGVAGRGRAAPRVGRRGDARRRAGRDRRPDGVAVATVRLDGRRGADRAPARRRRDVTRDGAGPATIVDDADEAIVDDEARPATRSGRRPRPGAARRSGAGSLFAAIAIGVVVVDQSSKAWVDAATSTSARASRCSATGCGSSTGANSGVAVRAAAAVGADLRDRVARGRRR